jgi:hypothetical protein
MLKSQLPVQGKEKMIILYSLTIFGIHLYRKIYPYVYVHIYDYIMIMDWNHQNSETMQSFSIYKLVI